MKRFLGAVRDLGMLEVFRRGAGRAQAQWSDFARLLRRRRARLAVSRLPERPKAIILKSTEAAALSIAVLGDDDWRPINRCLEALQHEFGSGLRARVRVYYRSALDAQLRMHSGVHLIPFSEPPHVARLFADASGCEIVYAIDARVVPEPGAVAALIATFDLDPAIAAACSKICGPNGAIDEAGRAVDAKGALHACGTGAPENDSRYDFVRDVDCISPASFAIRLSAAHEIVSRLQACASPAYEVADLCRELQASGRRCVLQPRSVAFRAGAVIERANEGARFAAKWSAAEGPPVMRSPGTILFVDEHVPFDDRDAGSRRMASLVRWARDAGWNVLFGSRDRRSYGKYSDRLRQAGIEVLLGFAPADVMVLRMRGSDLRCVWLSRPAVAAAYLPAVRSAYPGTRAIYDTVDLHFVRLSRQALIEKRDFSHDALRRLELKAANDSDFTVVTTAEEASILRERGVKNLGVVALSEVPPPSAPGYGARAGILFVGNFSHAPNVDAAGWLAREIMPRVWQRNPDISLTLAGADPVRAVKRLGDRRVRVTGYVEDLAPLFAAHRVFAAPLRFGAGLKGKIVQAIAAELPVVTTRVGAEGIARSEDDLAIADDPQEFADALLRLHESQPEWQRHSERARAVAQRFSPQAVAQQLYSVLESSETS